LTPFAGLKKEKGWRFYFLAYYLFLALTKPFPMLRYKLAVAMLPGINRRSARKMKNQKR